MSAFAEQILIIESAVELAGSCLSHAAPRLLSSDKALGEKNKLRQM